MKLIGLTGGVGMGKSTAAGFFLQSGIQLIDTDDLARELVEPGQPALAEIQDEFGPGFLTAAGALNRLELARLVFAEPEARKQLEAILHPRIYERWQAQADVWRRQNCPLAMVVIPLLFETGAEGAFDKIVCAACSPASQRDRLRGRGWTTEEIQGRLAAQLSVDEKMTRSHFVVWTEGSLASHRRQVEEIVKKLE
jgi:dephospho-CoA kinase